MKRIIVSACLVLSFVFGLSALAQTQSRRASRRGQRQRTANKPPKINSLTTSARTIALCPWTLNGTCSTSGLTLDVAVDSSDPEGGNLSFEYVVTGGQIIGEGSRVQWNFGGVSPGSYSVKVLVSDQRGGVASSTANVTIEICDSCHPPCHELRLSCPENAQEGQSFVVSVSISGGESDMKPTYSWFVSSGTIIKGQGTHTIEVDASGLAGRKVEATVKIGGGPPECQNEASCEVKIREKP